MENIKQSIEKLSEILVLAEPTDLRSIADLHTGFEDIRRWAADTSTPVLVSAADAAAKLLERIVLGEVADPKSSLQVIGAGLAAFQEVIRDGRGASDVRFPQELGLSDAQAADEHQPETRPGPMAGPAAQPPREPTADAQPPSTQPPLGQAKSTPLAGDLGLLGEFVTESMDHLEMADIHLLTLETEPRNDDALNAVFRAFHTIKGVAGFLALEEIQALSHESENLLDRARKGDLLLEGPAIDVTFEAVDALKSLVNSVKRSLSTGEPLASEPSLTSLLEHIKNLVSGGAVVPPAAPAEQTDKRLGEILVAAGKVTPEKVEAALERQQEPLAAKKIGEILVEANVVSQLTLDTALKVQEGSPETPRLGEVLVRTGAVDPEDMSAALRKQQEPPSKPKLGELLARDGEVPAKDVAQALRSQKGAAQPQATMQVKEAVKVDADRLDRLVDTIGELVIAESMVSQSAELRNHASAQLARQLSLLDKITRELQEMATSLRMVPVRNTFQKMARLVHDLAKKSGKPVEFVMSGEDTELDKSVVDKIGDPLVHMVRNAVDHGLEATPEDRRRAGKPETGRIELRAFHKGGSIYVEIQDDGRGLDREAILAKARERGLAHGGEIMSDREVFNLIFAPGLSTAKTVTAVSGRGVGMDVVKKHIDSLRGQVEIQSERGKGSVFSIRLPLTLAIIDGMVVRVGRERYIIPTLSIIRSIRPEARQISTVLKRGEMITLHDKLIPLFRLDRLFNIADAEPDPGRGIVVVVESDGRQAGLLSDELMGQQQIVIKSLGESLQGVPGVSGGAIMPDGQVGLILDVGGIVRLVNHDGSDSGRAGTARAKETLRGDEARQAVLNS